MAPAALRPGERPTSARVVRRRQLSASLRRLVTRDPLHLEAGRFVPPRLVRGSFCVAGEPDSFSAAG